MKNLVLEKLFFLLLLLVIGCSKDKLATVLSTPPGCDSAEFSYSKDIRPVISANCSGPPCHSGGNSNYDFRTYAVIADRIRAGSFEDRILLPLENSKHMPVGRELGTCDLFTLRLWIHQGFRNN